MCGCHDRCCKCLASAVLEWSGDRDFTGDLDIRNYPGYIAALTDGQPVNTASLWRIRYNPDQAFVEWLTDNKIQLEGSGPYAAYYPYSSESVTMEGPIREGLVYGFDAEYSAVISPSPEMVFPGTANLKYWNTNGSAIQNDWTFEDWPGNPVSLPWVLETGCTRCCCMDTANWPRHTRFYYDPEVRYFPGSPGGNGGSIVNPAESTLTSAAVNGCSNAMTGEGSKSIYWPGDSEEPNHAPVCPPVCMVWENGARPGSGSPSNTAYGLGPSKEYPGSPDPATPPKAYQIATNIVATSWQSGWTGRVYSHDGFTGLHGNVPAARSTRGDAAEIDDIPCLFLVNTAGMRGDGNMVFAYTFGFVTADVQWLIDWLALGDKTLLIDTPIYFSDQASVGAGISFGPPNANLFLSAIGSGMTLTDMPRPDGGAPTWRRMIVESTETHSLAIDPEQLLQVDWVPGSPGSMKTGDIFVELTNYGIDGGTPLFQARLQASGTPYIDYATVPVVSIEETGTNRIILGSLATWRPSGGGAADVYTQHWGADGGLTHTPNIGNFIGRVLATV
jgi:hypothetical protein